MSHANLTPAEAPRLLDFAALAAYLGVPDRTAQRLIYDRLVPVVRVGRRTYADRVNLDSWLAANAENSGTDPDCITRDGAK